MRRANPRTPIGRIIDDLGVAALAKALGHENVSTVSSWKIRGNIPVDYWQQVIDFAKAQSKDLTPAQLMDACTSKPAPTHEPAPSASEAA